MTRSDPVIKQPSMKSGSRIRVALFFVAHFAKGKAPKFQFFEISSFEHRN